MQQINQSIYYEDSFLGVTVGAMVFSHGVIAIDAPLRAEDSRSWRSSMNNYRGGSNRLLISLDAHPDRTLGARALECTIVAHQKAALVFRNRPTIFKGMSVETGAVWETYNDAIGMRWVPPDITFSEKMLLHWGGPEVIIQYQPGPTPGSIWVVIPEAKTIFVGDTVVINQPPFLAQADLDAWLQSLNSLHKEYAGYQIVSGRGGIAAPEDIRNLQKILKIVSEEIGRMEPSNSEPDAIQNLATKLLHKYSASPKLRDLFATRLRYGLYQCYLRRFLPANVIVQPDMQEVEEQ
jgi:glyoxylase-like metal-dependent hydrolase (beta-lactamase superfamily II)